MGRFFLCTFQLTHINEKKDFNAEFKTWLNAILDETIGTTPEQIDEQIDDYSFFLDEAKLTAIQTVYNRLQQLPKQTSRTAKFLGVDNKTIYNHTKNTA